MISKKGLLQYLVITNVQRLVKLVMFPPKSPQDFTVVVRGMLCLSLIVTCACMKSKLKLVRVVLLFCIIVEEPIHMFGSQSFPLMLHYKP